MQDTYEKVLRRPRFLRHDQDLAYLLRVLRNTWISSRRTAATAVVDPGGEEIEAIEDPRDPVAQAIEMGPLYDALRGLTPPLREAVIAVDVVGLSYKDAARALRTKEGTVMSRLHRGRSRIAQQLGT